MKVPISWLHDYVDVKDIPIEELSHKLTLAGLEVEEGFLFDGVDVGGDGFAVDEAVQYTVLVLAHLADSRAARLDQPRRADDHRRPRTLFEQCAFLPNSIVFAQVVSMVTPEDDDRVVVQLKPLERVQHASHLCVDE